MKRFAALALSVAFAIVSVSPPAQASASFLPTAQQTSSARTLYESQALAAALTTSLNPDFPRPRIRYIRSLLVSASIVLSALPVDAATGARVSNSLGGSVHWFALTSIGLAFAKAVAEHRRSRHRADPIDRNRSVVEKALRSVDRAYGLPDIASSPASANDPLQNHVARLLSLKNPVARQDVMTAYQQRVVSSLRADIDRFYGPEVLQRWSRLYTQLLPRTPVSEALLTAACYVLVYRDGPWRREIALFRQHMSKVRTKSVTDKKVQELLEAASARLLGGLTLPKSQRTLVRSELQLRLYQQWIDDRFVTEKRAELKRDARRHLAKDPRLRPSHQRLSDIADKASLVIIDWDGTAHDTNRYRTEANVEALGLLVSQVIYEHNRENADTIPLPSLDKLERLYKRHFLSFGMIFAECGLPGDPDLNKDQGYLERFLKFKSAIEKHKEAALVSGLIDFVDRLRARGKRVSVITANEEARKLLERNNIRGHFDSDIHVGENRRKMKAFLDEMEAAGLKASEGDKVLLITDGKRDIEEGRVLGMTTMALTGPLMSNFKKAARKRYRKLSVGADFVIPDLDDPTVYQKLKRWIHRAMPLKSKRAPSRQARRLAAFA